MGFVAKLYSQILSESEISKFQLIISDPKLAVAQIFFPVTCENLDH